MKTRWSAIIPTRNRVKSLMGTLDCLVSQNLPPAIFEVLVVDNGSTDATPEKVRAFIEAHPKHRIRYIREEVSGLLAGRHCGAREAQAGILTFFDDDVAFGPGFASHVLYAFADEKTALVGGPSVPRFLAPLPEWIERYFTWENDCLTCNELSLFDIGDKEREIAPEYVWGLNFSIRKQVLYELGGFHPDGVPDHMLAFRGDGETALSLMVKENGLRSMYVPGARVEHIIPGSRLTRAYFEKRRFIQGVSDSYTEIRARKGVVAGASFPAPVRVRHGTPEEVHDHIRNAYVNGYIFHQKAVKKSPALLAWVLREDYFDYAYPPLDDDLEVWHSRDWAGEMLRNPMGVLGDEHQAHELVYQYAANGQWREARLALGQLREAVCGSLGEDGLVAHAKRVLQRAPGSPGAFFILQQLGKDKKVLTPDERYDSAFYAEQSQGSDRSASIVVPVIQDIFSAKSVVDFGCGVGTWLKHFKDHGAEKIVGYDCNRVAQRHLIISHECIRQGCDFTAPFAFVENVDLAISLEVAEHLPEESADVFVSMLAKAAPCVVFSAALPSQTGVCHINEQPLSFWNDLFKKKGFEFFDPIRPRIMNNQDVQWWYRQNIVVYVDSAHLSSNPGLREKLLPFAAEGNEMTYISTFVLERLCREHSFLRNIVGMLCGEGGEAMGTGNDAARYARQIKSYMTEGY